MSVLETAPPLPEEIAACFDHPDRQAIAILKRLRELIFQTAAETPDVGELTESLKWGEPSYTPEKPRTGSSVRLATTRDGKPAAFFICHTHLVDRFRDIYPDVFTFEGNRALVFDPDRPLREPELMHCFAMALTYHLDFKRG